MFSKLKSTFKALIVSLAFLLPGIGNAQLMPVGVNILMNPPASPFLSDYYSIDGNLFQAFITLNDLNEPTWDVRLVVTVEGQGINIETKRTYIPLSPINLIAGIPVTVEGLDFEPYMNVNNVNLQGITAATLNQSGKLPEGLYNFCVEVLDFNTGTPLSQKACASVFIFYENPPILMVPECESVLQPTDPQNIFFHWQLAGGASPTIAATSQYKLFVYELQDENENPYFAVQNSKALLIYESDYQQSTSQTIDFGISNSAPLTAGKRYIFRVRALDANGKNIYKNDGYSEFCWFFYGYPSDGVIAINSPEDGKIFSKLDNKSFNWSASDKGVPGQEYDYVITIKEKNVGQSKEDAMENNPEWFSYIKPTTTSMNGSDYLLMEELESGKNYVWQVKALTGTQEVAKSEVYEFFAPSEIDQFMAGNFPIKIVSLNGYTKNGSTYTGVNGKGRVQLSDDPTDYVDAEFTNIEIKDLAGTLVMTQGSFTADISSREAKILEPMEEVNGNAKFLYSQAVINSSGVKIKGQVEWPFPHATNSGQLETVTSQEVSYTLNSSFKLNGSSTLGQNKEYLLLEPSDLNIKLDASTEINVASDLYELKFNGAIEMNSNVRTNDGNPYSLKLLSQKQLYYFTANNLLIYSNNYITPVQNLNIGFMPKSAIVDLSETESPEKILNNPSWKGIYFPEFQTRLFEGQFDASNQMTIPMNIDYHEDLTLHEFWITNLGVHLKYDFYSEETGIFFNKFRTTLTGKLNIHDNEVSSSNFKGGIKIPVINEQDIFTFEIPVNTQGLQQGFLNEDLTMREIVFNPFGGENRVEVDIKRAVFADNERLDMEIDATLAGFNCTISGINDFRIYGDNVIGVGGRNGSKALDNRVSGKYRDFDAYITDVGASLFNGNYVFSYLAEMDLGEGVSGDNGAPTLAVSSITPVGGDVEVPVYSPGNPQPEPQIEVPTDEDAASSQTLTSVEMSINVNNSVVDLTGTLKLRANDPVWGTSFAGGINGKIKIPTEIEAGANMILGNREGVDFWYFDAWFNDTQGMGVKVGTLFNITAFEGRIYRHMSKQDGEFMVDPALAFGGAIYLQVIDPGGGRLFAADIGAELKVFEDGEFTLSMEGDAAILNSTQRTAVTGSVTGAVGEELLEEIAESIGPLSLTVSVGGGELTVAAESVKKGSISYEKGDMNVGFNVDVSSTPGIGFDYSQGSTSFGINADAGGEFGIDVGIGSTSFGIGLSGTSGGYLDFAYDDITFGATINKAQKSGGFNFGFGGKEFGLSLSPSSGSILFKLDPTKSFDAGFSTAGSAHIGFQYDDYKFKLSGDKTNKAGSLDIVVPGFEMLLAANANEKSARAKLKTSDFLLDIGGKYGAGGNFNLATNDFSVDIEADIPSKTGLLAYSFDGGNKSFSASLDGGSTGNIKMKHNDIEFGIGGNADGSAGMVSFKDGSNEFSVHADKNAGTGGLTFLMDGNGLESEIASDSSFVKFTYDQYEFAAGITSAGAGGLTYKDGSTAFGLFGDPSAKAGSFNLEFTGNKIAFGTDLTNKKHSVDIDISGTKFMASSETDKVQAEFEHDNHYLKLAKNPSASGSGSAGLAKYSDGTNTFEIEADPNAGAGKLVVDLGGDAVTTEVNSDTSYLSINIDGYLFATGYNSQGTGMVKYSNGGNKFELVGNPSAKKGSVDLDFSGNSLSLSSDIPAQEHSIAVESSGVTFNASSTATDKELKVAYSGYEVFAKKESDAYGVGVTVNNRTITGGFDDNRKYIAYAGDGIELELATDKIKLSTGGNTLEITEEDLLINGSTVEEFVASQNASFSKTVGSLTTTITLNSGEYSLAFSSGGNQFSITTSDFSNGKMNLTVNGNEIDLARDNDNYTLAVNGYEAAYAPNSLTLSKGEDRKLNITNSSLAVDYDGYTFEVNSDHIAYSDGTNAAELSSDGLSLSRDEHELFLGDQKFGLKSGDSKKIELTDNSIAVQYDAFSASYEEGKAIEVGYDDYSFKYEDGKVELAAGSNRKLEVGDNSLGVEFDGYKMNVTPVSFSYLDGNNAAEISEDGLKLSRGQNSLFISEDQFGVDIGGDKHLYVGQKSLDLQYENYLASFSASNSLSFTDGTRSFALGTSGLEMSDGDNRIAVLDDGGLPAIELGFGSNKFELSQKGFAVEYGGKRYAVNETEYLNLEIDNTRSIDIMNNGVKYTDGSYEFALGGDDNLVSLTDGTRTFALTQDDKLYYEEGDYYASISKTLEAEYRDGTRAIKLFSGDHYLKYEQGTYNFGIRGANAATPGIDFSYDDYSFFIEGVRNSGLAIGVTTPQVGTITASVNSQKEIMALLKTGATTGHGFAVKNGNVRIINGEVEPPVPQDLEGAPTIPAQDGPSHLTNSIADEMGGSIRGNARIFFDSRNDHFMMTAAVKGNQPICIEGAMAMDVSPGQFHLDIGTEQQRVEIYPTCSGFGGGGWLGIHNTNVDVGVFFGWRASAGIEIGSDVCGAGLSAEASAELGVKANLDLDPFKINSAGVWIDLRAGIYAHYWAVGVSGSITIAEVRLAGELMVYFEEKTRVTGKLAGSITILSIISASFDMSFNTSF